MLKLETESGGTTTEPTAGDVARALRALDGEGNNFAILSRAPNEYIQAAGKARDGLTVEYHDPVTDTHYAAAATPVELDRALELFEDYRRGGTQWMTMIAWRAMEIPSRTRRGCGSGAAAIVVVVIAGIVWAVRTLT